MTLTSQKSPLAVSLSLSHTHVGLRGVSINFPRPRHFYIGVLPGITYNNRHINSDDLGGHLVLRIEDQERNIRSKDEECNWFGDCEDSISSILKDGITYVSIKS